MGKRENNKLLIRERLLDYSFNLFQKNGIENTTVSDIIEVAGIGRGTFYNYFTDVNDIFDTIIENLNNIESMIRKNVRDMKYTLRAKEFDNKKDFLLLSFMLVGTPPELFVNAHQLKLNISNEELATFLTKMYSKVLNK